jgi:hypothetical protein
MTDGKYKVIETYSTTYMNDARKLIKGFTVSFMMTEYDEYHEIDVPNLAPETVSKAINALIANRDALDNL